VAGACNAEMAALTQFFETEYDGHRGTDILAGLLDTCEQIKSRIGHLPAEENDVEFELESNRKESHPLEPVLASLQVENEALDKFVQDPLLLLSERNVRISPPEVSLPAETEVWLFTSC
jgi:hypothetical protein